MGRNVRFSIIYVMIGTSIIAVFCAAFVNDSQWWRAILGTITMAMILNALLAAIFSVGERRAFSLSYFVGALFFVPALYTYMASLPYLVTMKLIELIGVVGPRKENCLIVATIFWLQLTCLSAGLIGRRWFRIKMSESNKESPPSELP